MFASDLYSRTMWCLFLSNIKITLQYGLQPLHFAPDTIVSTLKQFEQWDFVIHLKDGQDMQDLELHKIDDYPVQIINYNIKNYVNVTRPATARCIHLVDYSNPAFLEYAKIVRNIQDMDIVIFLTEKMPLSENFTNWYQSGIENANVVFVISKAKALSIYFFSSPTYTPYVQEVVSNKSGIYMLKLYQNDFKDFYGFPLKIGYTSCPPFIYNLQGEILGVEFEVLKIVTSKLNIKPVLEDFSNIENARIALIDAMNKSEQHFGIGCLANNALRNEKAEFSAEIKLEPHITVYASVEGRYGPGALYAITAPLNPIVWLYSGISLIVISVLVKMVKIVVWGPNNESVNAAMVPIKILLEQSTYIPNNNTSLRLTLLLWIIAGFILSSSYKSKLTAALVMPDINEPTTLEELVDQGYHFISPAIDSTYLIELLKYSDHPFDQRVGNVLEDTKVVSEAVDRILVEWSAIVEEQSVIRDTIWNYCSQYLSAQQMASLRRLYKPTTTNGHVWAMPKDAPYRDAISRYLHRMKSYGLVDKWYNSFNISRTIMLPNTKTDTRKEPLRMQDLSSAWISIGFGLVVSAGAFLYEILPKIYLLRKQLKQLKPRPPLVIKLLEEA